MKVLTVFVFLLITSFDIYKLDNNDVYIMNNISSYESCVKQILKNKSQLYKLLKKSSFSKDDIFVIYEDNTKILIQLGVNNDFFKTFFKYNKNEFSSTLFERPQSIHISFGKDKSTTIDFTLKKVIDVKENRQYITSVVYHSDLKMKYGKEEDNYTVSFSRKINNYWYYEKILVKSM